MEQRVSAFLRGLRSRAFGIQQLLQRFRYHLLAGNLTHTVAPFNVNEAKCLAGRSVLLSILNDSCNDGIAC